MARGINCSIPLRTKSRSLKSRSAEVTQSRPVVLLHGYAQTSHMWRPLIPQQAATHTVLAPDLRGAGQSSAPVSGYAKAAMSQEIHAVVRKLGFEHIRIVGHDIGLMVAYAYAAQYS
jgi:pimeloyl-ACP methyl ester carboxylesterase